MFTELEKVVLEKAKKIIARKASGNKKAFRDPSVVKQYLTIANAVCEPEREVFRALFLDSQHRLISDETIFYGTIDAAAIYPRVIVHKSLNHNAAALIISHNHPSGVAEPSIADKAITERIKRALEVVDIALLDHFVVGENEVVSFAERGWL